MNQNMDLPFETLLKSNGLKSRERWYPCGIDTLRCGFALDKNIIWYHPLVDNLAYSIQYLQFLDKEMNELSVPSVIYTMLVKNFVITGMSVCEGIFFNIIKSNDWWEKTDEETVTSFTNEQVTCGGKDTLIIRTEILKHGKIHESEMNLDDMINCLEKKKHHKGLEIDHFLYPALDRLRKLRNRVHLETTPSADNDHDYNAFNSDVRDEMKKVLYGVLCSDRVTKPEYISNYDWLKPSE